MSGSLDKVRDEMRGRLRALDLRATAPRLAVLVELHEAARPMTHDDVMEQL